MLLRIDRVAHFGTLTACVAKVSREQLDEIEVKQTLGWGEMICKLQTVVG